MALNQISNEILTVFNREVDVIVNRVDNSKTKKDIVNWLDNFDDKDKIDALEILERLTYIGEDELKVRANEIVKELDGVVPRSHKIYFYPIGKFGKSSFLFSYYINKSPLFNQLERTGRVRYISNKFLAKEAHFDRNVSVVFFDDFFGTGNSFIKHYRYIQRVSPAGFSNVDEIYLAGVYYMESAKQSIKAVIPKIKLIGEVHHKIFDDAHLFFSTVHQNGVKKKLALSYGAVKHLFRENGNDFSLGYEHSEALLVFSYAPPNNTLPIIWSSKSKWDPLFPRSSENIFASLKKFRQENAHIAAQLQLELSFDEQEIFAANQVKTIIIAILRMLHKKYPIPKILLILNLRSNELSEYHNIAVNMGYLTNKMEFTPAGEKVLKTALLDISAFKSANSRVALNSKVKYMPKVIAVE